MAALSMRAGKLESLGLASPSGTEPLTEETLHTETFAQTPRSPQFAGQDISLRVTWPPFCSVISLRIQSCWRQFKKHLPQLKNVKILQITSCKPLDEEQNLLYDLGQIITSLSSSLFLLFKI